MNTPLTLRAARKERSKQKIVEYGEIILEAMWGIETYTVDALIKAGGSKIRELIEENPQEKNLILKATAIVDHSVAEFFKRCSELKSER